MVSSPMKISNLPKKNTNHAQILINGGKSPGRARGNDGCILIVVKSI